MTGTLGLMIGGLATVGASVVDHPSVVHHAIPSTWITGGIAGSPKRLRYDAP